MTATPAPRTLLLAEDDAASRLIIQTFLERAGHRVVVVDTGLAALEALRQRTYDAVLMSVELPELSGLEVARLIRAEEATRGRRIPLFALISQDSPEAEPRCHEAGMDGCLPKPVRSAMLQRLISQLPAVEVMDPARLLSLSGGDAALAKEVVRLFLADSPALCTSMHQALEQGDADTLARAAHKLKGSLLNLAAGPATDAARELEALARAGRLTEAWQAFAILRMALSKLCHVLEALP